MAMAIPAVAFPARPDLPPPVGMFLFLWTRRASLKLLDIIIAVDGRPVGDVAELQEAIAGHKPGDAVQLVFVREVKVHRTTLILDGF